MTLITNVVRGTDAQSLLFLLHGYGADESDLGALLTYLDPEGKFAAVMPRGPLDAPGAPGYSWFPIGAEGLDAPAFDAALNLLDAFVDEQCGELGFAREQEVSLRLLRLVSSIRVILLKDSDCLHHTCPEPRARELPHRGRCTVREGLYMRSA